MALSRGEKVALALLALFLAGLLLWAVRASRPGIAVQAAAAPAAVLAGGDGETSDELAPGEIVNINTASAAELEKLPGIGTVLAGRIAADREANGPFAAIGDIQRVAGIGEAKFDALKDYITVK